MTSLPGRPVGPDFPATGREANPLVVLTGRLERCLSPVFRISGFLSAFFLFLIALFVVAQIVARLVGSVVPSADEFAGFSMSAASFLGLGYAFRRGFHIRVTLVRERIGPGPRIWLDRLASTAALCMIGYLTLYAWQLIIESVEFGDVTEGLVPLPLWLPQSGMIAGLTVMFLAVLLTSLRAWAGLDIESAAPESAQTAAPS